MPHFCFISPSAEREVGSPPVLLEVLRSLGEVDHFSYDGVFSRGDDDLVRTLAGSNYDSYVFWGSEKVAERLISFELGRFVIVPMYDAGVGRSEHYWKMFPNAQFISFSRTLHEALRAIECQSAHFRYFPPLPERVRSTGEKLGQRDAFFWERTPGKQLNLTLILRLCKLLRISHLHIHFAPDLPARHDREYVPDVYVDAGIQITTSVGVENCHALAALAANHLFYFAPRAIERIEIAFLEAIGRGQVVVAPDSPTMNEYISHGVSGILYDPNHPRLDIDVSDSRLLRIARGAARKALFARGEWEKDIARLKSLLMQDGRRWSTPDFSSSFLNGLRKGARDRAWQGSCISAR